MLLYVVADCEIPCIVRNWASTSLPSLCGNSYQNFLTTLTRLYCKRNGPVEHKTYDHYATTHSRESCMTEHRTVDHPVTWCLSEVWRCVRKLLVEKHCSRSGLFRCNFSRGRLEQCFQVAKGRSVSASESFGSNALPVAELWHWHGTGNTTDRQLEGER